MSENAFRALQALLPSPRVVVGIVTEVHADDTSTVQLPGPADLSGYAASVFTGSLIRARGATVPVGKRAFVRDWPTGWVIETQAPGGDVLDLPVGIVVLPPPPDPPAAPTTGTSSRLSYRGATADIQYLTAYRVRNPAAAGVGGGFLTASGWVISSDTLTATVAAGSSGAHVMNSVDVFTLSPGYYAAEIVISDIKTGSACPPLLGAWSTKASGSGRFFIAGYDATAPGFYANISELDGSLSGIAPETGSSAALVIGDVIGIVYRLINRSAEQGCLVDIYKNGTLEVHGCLLPYGQDPTLWTLGKAGAYW